MTFRTDPEDAVVYEQQSTGLLYLLADKDMYDYFQECRDGTPEAPLVDWAVDQFGGLEHNVIDVGCHVGTWTIPFAWSGARVTAYEAQPWIAKLCRVGVTLNSLDYYVKIYERAVTDVADDMVTLQAPHRDGGGGSIVRTWDHPALEFTVRTTTLDATYDGPVRLIKIDAEGAELDVLRGAEQLIDREQPTIIFEAWSTEMGQRKEELLKYVNDVLEYKVVPLSWPDMWLAEPK